MPRLLDTRFGRIKPYRNNPRRITDGAFTKLCSSIDADPEFLELRPIVIDERNEILGGNQRQAAILSLNSGGWSDRAVGTLKTRGWECVLEGRLPDAWVRRMEKPPAMSDEDWEEKKQRFVLKDNSPEGMAGDFDYEIMGVNFSAAAISDSGIDFANLETGIREDAFKSAEETAEESDYGEKSEKLRTFKEHREKARECLDEMTDVRFYLCAVFQNHEQVKAFLDATGLPNEGEMFVSGLALAEKMGVGIEKIAYSFPTARIDSKLVEMAMEDALQDGRGD